MKPLTARLPQIAALLAAGVFALMFFITVAPRLTYRYDLDFDEDSILMQSLRVADGLPVYIAPNAEFTPKTVETADLRTDLVYRMRIIVSDPDDALRQGQPVSVAVVNARPGKR